MNETLFSTKGGFNQQLTMLGAYPIAVVHKTFRY